MPLPAAGLALPSHPCLCLLPGWPCPHTHAFAFCRAGPALTPMPLPAAGLALPSPEPARCHAPEPDGAQRGK